ncbi:glycoside hydrolase family 19 protein, partial [Paraburkholderia rhizosphaerae]
KSTPNGLAAWSRYPLQVKAATEPVNGRLLILPRTQLDGLDGDVRAIDDHGVRWWRVQAIPANGEYQSGWVCEKDHPGTQWESPWAWPGFELVDATGIQLTDAFLRNLSVTDSANSEEKRKFAPSTEAVNNSVLLRRLEEIVARSPVPGGGTQPPDEDGRIAVTAVKLQRATSQPGLGSELAHLVLRYESEWGGNMARWEAITPLMRNARENWECELQRIKKLQWWDDVKGKVDGFPDSPVVHHIHPVALVANFSRRPTVTTTMLRKIWTNSDVPVETLSELAGEINSNMSGYRLDTEFRLAHFFAQVREETGSLFRLEEVLDYVPNALKSNFSYFRNHPSESEMYGRTSLHAADQQEIANRAYNGISGVTSLGNGSIESRDGWRYRGRGLKQTTGRYNYTAFNAAYPDIWPGENVDFVKNPELLSQMKYAVRAGVFFWLNAKLYEIADETDMSSLDGKVDDITRVINKSTSSYAARRSHFRNILNNMIFSEFAE